MAVTVNNSQTNSNFMSSGTRTDKYKLYLLLQEISYDSDTNYSDVYMRLWIQGVNTSTTFYGSKMNGTIKNGNETLFTGSATATSSKPVSSANPYTLAEGTKSFKHNDDGTLTITITGIYSSTAGHAKSGEVSTTLTLTTIPRASTIIALDADIESPTIIKINKMSDSFTTTLQYVFGSLSGDIVSKYAGYDYGWYIPATFYSQIPNDPSGICTIKAITYNGDNIIGTKETTLRVTANKDLCKPTGTISAIDINEITRDATGDEKVIAKNASNALVAYTTTPKNSSSIKSVKINGISVSEINSETTLNKVSTDVFTLSIVDSRGYDNIITETNTSIPYIPLSLKADFKRNTPTDGKIKLKYEGKFFNGNFGVLDNTLTVEYTYKLKNATSYNAWKTLDPTIDGNTFAGEIILEDLFDYQKEYELQIRAKDSVSVGIIYNQLVTRGIPNHWWNRDSFNVEVDFYVKSQKLILDNHPVGSLYFTTDDTNPKLYFGGEWELYAQGKTIIGYDANDTDFNTIGKTGGSKSLQAHTHTFTTSWNGDHNHVIGGQTDSLPSGSTYARPRGYSSGVLETTYDTSVSGGHNHTGTTDNAGDGNSGNLQPYIVTYIWQRIA